MPELTARPARKRDDIVVITGAGQGIARRFAHAFAESGASVVVADRRGEAAEQVAAEIAEQGGTAIAVSVDVSDEEQVAALAARVDSTYGRLDALVNSAAVFSTLEMKPFEEIPLAEWTQVLAVNTTGVFLCCRALAPLMRRQRRGCIVNVSSATVLSGRPHYLHYVASKSALVGMTRALARELGPDEIRVNAVLPGSVETGIPRDSARPDAVAGIIGGQAIHRRLVSDDVTGTALFLASDAAAMITGQSVVVDGGMDFL